jgi:signal peptide peptidase SppA
VSDSLITSTPWLIDESAWPRVEAMMLAATKFRSETPKPEARSYRSDYSQPPDTSPREYAVINGIAVINIHGVLVKQDEWWNRYFDLVSCDGIRTQLGCALADTYVKAILFDFNTPGGEVNGVADCGDAIFEARGKKPLIGVANDYCCSSGIWLGTAVDQLYVTQSAITGSIGVMVVRYDYTEAQKKAGIGAYVIRAGKQKGYGSPSLPMTSDETKVVQANIDQLYENFVAAVARNRSTTPELVLEHWADARCFRGSAAVDVGLADEVSTLERVLAKLGAKPTDLDPDQTEDSTDASTDNSPDPDQSPNASGASSGNGSSNRRGRVWPRISRPFRRH